MTLRTGRHGARSIGWLALLALAAGCSPSGGPSPNVLLVTLDTTRADRLGSYGHRRETTPHLDSLAEHAVRYEDALSTSSWTLPAHASLFTGAFPSSHGARYDENGPLVLAEAIDAPQGVRASGLAEGTETLASRLSRAGYVTGAVVAGPWLLRTFGLASGFASYDDAGILDHGGRRAEDVTASALRFLAQTPPDQPFFLFLNYFDPHFPYDPPPAHAKRFLPEGTRPDPGRREQWDALYDAELHYADAQLGRVLDALRERGLYDRTLVVVTSDHGELLGEHGEWGHSRFLYQELVQVPLLVKPPGAPVAGRVESGRVQLVDLHDMLARATGLAPPGRRPVAEVTADPARPVLAEVRPMRGEGGYRAIWQGSWKLHHSGVGEHLLFDLARDSRERVNRFVDHPEVARAIVESLESAFAALPPPPEASVPTVPTEVDAATREALERLGYLGE
jgi:arylsulfatase A-like enzyme